ncbi:MAG: DNA repair protein RecN [Lachnospiraceae bacterium]|nr:DNA repair protein RecN [Lachnospiraceae bacterium]
MLVNVHVKNFAIIDEADIDLSDNLNIFTGETGAGKSLLLGALNMALGGRTPKDIVSEAADFALSELTFVNVSGQVSEKLAEQGIDASDELVISKKLMNNGRSVVRVNGETVTAAFVKELASSLIDIYGQNENQLLYSTKRQLSIIDEYAGSDADLLKADIKRAYSEYKALKQEADSCIDDEKTRARRLELLKYEIDEIEAAALKDGEEEDLKERHKLLANVQLIEEGLDCAYDCINGEGRISDSLSQAVKALSRVAEFDEKLASIVEILSDADNCISDAMREISGYSDSLPDDRGEIREIEERLDLLSGLKAKYGNSIEEINRYYDEACLELQKLEDFEGYRAGLQKKLEDAVELLTKKSAKLTVLRKKSAEQLEKKISEALLELNFNQVVFKIEMTVKDGCHSDGADECSFMISLNPGEKVKPLSEIASGGELSRIMLGIKSVMAGRDAIGTLIFDEIDAGISGRTAQKVSEKLCKIANDHQVVCITHLPQIAAMADSHYEIRKDVENGRTITAISRLSEDNIKYELARLTGGAEITETVLTGAMEMKQLADRRKQEIRGK